MVTKFQIDTVEERLKVYTWLQYRYVCRRHAIILNKGNILYKIDVINPFSLGICFYLKRTTNIKFEDLPEMYSLYKTKVKGEELLYPKGNLNKRILFIKETIKKTKANIKTSKS